MFLIVAKVCVAAALIAMLALFLEFCFRPGNVFCFWLDFWQNRWLKRNDPGFYEAATNDMTDDQVRKDPEHDHETIASLMRARVDWFWFKPLGGCVVCFAVWVAFACLPLFNVCAFNECLPIIDLLIANLAVVLLSNFLVRYFHGLLI